MFPLRSHPSAIPVDPSHNHSQEMGLLLITQTGSSAHVCLLGTKTPNEMSESQHGKIKISCKNVKQIYHNNKTNDKVLITMK